MSKKPTIVIADDHPMLLKGLGDELLANGYTVLGQAENGMQALQHIIEHQPDVALLDIDMPDLTGFEVIKMAKVKAEKTKFVVLSFHKESEYVAQARTLNIDGYLLKEDCFNDIELCIQSVVNDKVFFSKSFQDEALLDADATLKKLNLLTPSERHVIKMVANSLSTQDIADELNISPRTIEKHRSNIIDKLNLDKISNTLAHWAIANKNLILSL